MPQLPGCHSQGRNVDDALCNIADAIREYLEVYANRRRVARFAKWKSSSGSGCRSLPGVNHLRAGKALENAGFRINRQGKHILMSSGPFCVVIPATIAVDAYTMAAIVRDAGLTIDQFKEPALNRSVGIFGRCT